MAIYRCTHCGAKIERPLTEEMDICPVCKSPFPQPTPPPADIVSSSPPWSPQAATDGRTSFKVKVSRIKGLGLAGYGYHPGILVAERGFVRIESGSQSHNGALAGAVAGGLVGAVVGAVIDRAMAGPGCQHADPARQRAYYDPAIRRFNIELSDGGWVDIVPVARKNPFGEILAALQVVYGANLTPSLLGQLSTGRKVFVCCLAGVTCLVPAIGLVLGPIFLVVILILCAARKRVEPFQIVVAIIAVVGLLLNLFVYPLGARGSPMLP